MGVPPNGWFIMENPGYKWMIFWVAIFQETSIYVWQQVWYRKSLTWMYNERYRSCLYPQSPWHTLGAVLWSIWKHHCKCPSGVSLFQASMHGTSKDCSYLSHCDLALEWLCECAWHFEARLLANTNSTRVHFVPLRSVLIIVSDMTTSASLLMFHISPHV